MKKRKKVTEETKVYVCISEVCDEILDKSGGSLNELETNLINRIRDHSKILSKKK